MENYNLWQLIQNGYFTEACEKADLDFKKTSDLSHLRNKIYALFHLKNYNECILLSEKIISFDKGQTDSDFIFLGIAYWLCDKKEDAVNAWKSGLNSKYTDAAGGVELQIFLFFASVKMMDNKLNKNVLKRINKLVKSKNTMNYPGFLGKYLLNEIGEDSLFSSVSTVPILKERQLCQINFSIALKRIENGNLDEYIKKLKDAVSFGPASYLEHMYYLATGELEIMLSTRIDGGGSINSIQ
ncbi:MAG: hypothetical protein IPP81_11470 [Chitinophagaceae bacterium]|nr:hypothetical protein [Chitinophagaceae bacterium]